MFGAGFASFVIASGLIGFGAGVVIGIGIVRLFA